MYRNCFIILYMSKKKYIVFTLLFFFFLSEKIFCGNNYFKMFNDGCYYKNKFDGSYSILEKGRIKKIMDLYKGKKNFHRELKEICGVDDINDFYDYILCEDSGFSISKNIIKKYKINRYDLVNKGKFYWKHEFDLDKNTYVKYLYREGMRVKKTYLVNFSKKEKSNKKLDSIKSLLNVVKFNNVKELLAFLNLKKNGSYIEEIDIYNYLRLARKI
jgi:hypothetical protein